MGVEVGVYNETDIECKVYLITCLPPSDLPHLSIKEFNQLVGDGSFEPHLGYPVECLPSKICFHFDSTAQQLIGRGSESTNETVCQSITREGIRRLL